MHKLFFSLENGHYSELGSKGNVLSSCTNACMELRSLSVTCFNSHFELSIIHIYMPQFQVTLAVVIFSGSLFLCPSVRVEQTLIYILFKMEFFCSCFWRKGSWLFVVALKQVLHPQSMRPAREGDIPVRVKNSYNPKAPGTLITKHRDMDKVCSRLIQTCSHTRTIFLSV